MRQTRILCTIGPACRSTEKMVKMIAAGMDLARLHFSYGGQEEHAENIERLRRASRLTGKRVGVLQDLSGSKVRMRRLWGTSGRLEADTEFTLTTRDACSDKPGASLSVPELVAVVEPGDLILLDDGALRLRVLSGTDTDLRCKVLLGGTIKAQQAVYVPGKAPPVSVPTAKDRQDAFFGIQRDVDWIALSYGTTGSEVEDLRAFIQEQGAEIPIVAKIERRAAMDNLDDMIDAADAVMVARGDLGLEIPLEEIALVQKEIIHRSIAAHKPVITATEMLVSMMEQPQPTRAEVADIANTILDGSDALMLSGETAVGKYPIEAVTVMARVALATELRRHEIDWMRASTV